MRTTVMAVIMLGILTGPARPAAHTLLGEANEGVWGPSMPDGAAREAGRRPIGGDSTNRTLIPLTVDYPLEGAVFPPDMAAPTFVWRDPASQADAAAVAAPKADTWLIDIACEGTGDHLYVLTQGATPPSARDSDPRTASEAAAAYQPPPAPH